VRDECYYSDSELVTTPDGRKLAPTGADVVFQEKEETYFFALSKYTQPLLDFYDANPDFIQPPSRRNEVLNFVKQGLNDLSISRTKFSWGIPVPGDPDHVMYVWIDALVNYVSALGYGLPDGPEGASMATHWPAAVHIVGKDILRFHAIYWPALLLSAGLQLPGCIYAHGWWLRSGAKMSKSLGNVVDPFALVNSYGVDYTRYFLMSAVTFGADGDFSDEEMVLKCNAALANGYGNLVQRTLSLVFKNCGGVLPEPGDLTPDDEAILKKVRSLTSATDEHMNRLQINLYARHLVDLVTDANQYIDVQAPWALKKTDPKRMETVLWVLCEVIRCITLGFQPLIPESSGKILDQLKIPMEQRGLACIGDGTSAIRAGTHIDKPVGVFPRLEMPKDEAA
jgi:methionyl-tRNA synthetase